MTEDHDAAEHQIEIWCSWVYQLALLGQRRGQRSTLLYLCLPLRWTRSNLRCLASMALAFRPPSDYGSEVTRRPRATTAPR
jgi:hypothetical protein